MPSEQSSTMFLFTDGKCSTQADPPKGPGVCGDLHSTVTGKYIAALANISQSHVSYICTNFTSLIHESSLFRSGFITKILF